MFDTFQITLTNISRNLAKKIQSSPVLYLFFSLLILLSIIMFAFLTLFLMNAEANFSLTDLYFGLFFIFMLKAAADTHTYFVQAPELSYSLSTQKPQTITIAESILAVLILQVGIWFLFSSVYLFFAALIGINIYYPTEYLNFTIGTIIASLLGSLLCIYYFSPYRSGMLTPLLFLGIYWYVHDLFFISLTLPLVVLYFLRHLSDARRSYRFVHRKKRSKKAAQQVPKNILLALFSRETTILWRDNLFFSFVFFSSFSAFGTIYLMLYGSELFIPKSIQGMVEALLPSMFVFIGVYVVIIYTSVFPTLNLFLNEEKTMWILRNLPLSTTTIVYGKTLTLLLCFLTTIPFLAFLASFVTFDTLLFLIWLITLSFLLATSLSLPIGAKYVGKKTDVLLLYSVSMILFILIGFAAVAGNFLWTYVEYSGILLLGLLGIGCVFLIGSLHLSASILASKKSYSF